MKAASIVNEGWTNLPNAVGKLAHRIGQSA